VAYAEYNYKKGKFTGLTTNDINAVDSVGDGCQWVPQLQATPPAAQPAVQAELDAASSQEPIGEVRNGEAYFYNGMYTNKTDAPDGTKLYTAPPAAQPAAPVQEPLMVDMHPPATQRDRWMYEQGRLAERDPRSHPTPPAAPMKESEDRQLPENAARLIIEAWIKEKYGDGYSYNLLKEEDSTSWAWWIDSHPYEDPVASNGFDGGTCWIDFEGKISDYTSIPDECTARLRFSPPAEEPAPVQEPDYEAAWHKVWPDAGAFVRASSEDLIKFAKTISKTSPAAHQCKWPTCQTEEHQQALADQIKQELVTGKEHSEWVPVTKDLLAAQHPWLYEEMWLAMKDGGVMTGHYKWMQGRDPDRFVIGGCTYVWAFKATHVMPVNRPKHPTSIS
jgi:hypothetical protein